MSIPNLILKSKNIHENKVLNQIDLFSNHSKDELIFLEKIEDWVVDVKLTKEFETLGFYISDHPLNQYKSAFNQYKIVNYDEFENNTDILSSNIACTVLKIQEKKTQKGNSYAIVKFSDLTAVFELFIFSDVFELNRDKLKEGKSLFLTLNKTYIDETKTQKRINVKEITSLKDVVNKPIKNITFKFNNYDDLKKIKKLSKIDANTDVKVILFNNKNNYIFKLREKRKVSNNVINSLNLIENIVIE